MSDVMEMQGQLAFPGEIRKYVLGGNSTFTIRSKKTGCRLTSLRPRITKRIGAPGIRIAPLTL